MANDGPRRVLIDTDAANEIDDQFAIAWALLAPERLRVEAITAAPFSHGSYFRALLAAPRHRSQPTATPFEELAAAVGVEAADALAGKRSPADGMRASLGEIERIVGIAAPGEEPRIVAGADRFMSAADECVDSDAARTIVDLAHAEDRTLHVAVMGAPTNVAAALLLDPTIASKIEVVFVAGHPSGSSLVDDSFNLVQDRNATNRVFARDVDMTYLPGYGVAEVLAVSLPELDRFVGGRGELADALVQLFHDNPLAADPTVAGFSWVMWDLAPIAWLLDPRWVRTRRVRGAQVDAGHRWIPGDGDHREAHRIDRKAVYGDLFARFAT